MSNERLRDAITAAGLTPEQLADHIEVDAKTIERWITQDRTPYRRHRQRVARVLAVDEHDLWPDATPAPQPTTAEETQEVDLLAALPDQDQLEIDPRALLTSATRQVDLLGLTLSDLIDPEAVQALAAQADAGCQIRILLSHPDSIHLHLHEAELNPEARLSSPPKLRWDVERTLGHLQPLLARPEVSARLHLATPAVSILRADDQLLATLHLLPALPDQAPALHLQHREAAGLFARLMAHFELTWETATPISHNPERYPPPDAHPDRYRHPAPADRDFATSQAFSPAPPDSASPESKGEQPRPRRLRKPHR